MKIYLAFACYFVITLYSCSDTKSNSSEESKSSSEKKSTETVVQNNPNIKDYTPVLRSILEKASDEVSLKFEGGTYHFYPEKAQQKLVQISNNDNGFRKIIFLLDRLKSFSLDGGGSNFVFHGGVIPFEISNSDKIFMKKFNIYWDKPFTFEGEIVGRNEANNSFTLKINENNEYEIKQNEIFFKGYDWKLPLGENIIYNKEKLRPYYRTSDYLQWNKLKAKEISKGIVEFSGFNPNKKLPPLGSIYVDKGPHGQNRRYPAFHVTESSNITLNDINVYASGAMSLIAERCDTFSLNHFNVKLPKESKQMIGSSADATHFVNCKGLISFENCVFENMLDDATNVHGTYMVITEILNDHTIAVKPMHYQQSGFKIADSKDEIRFINRTDLLPVHSAIVKTSKQINEDYYVIEFEESLPKSIVPEMAVENTTWMASVSMKKCTVRQNRARSILISTSKKVEILDNYFSSMMAGVRVCGDANYWFESGPITDLTVKGNVFEDLGIGGAKPQAILQIDPIISKKYRKNGYFHKNITFDSNTIKTFDPHIIYALSVDNLKITNNTIIQTNTHKPIFSELSQFDIQNCTNVLIENNEYVGKNKAEISVLNSSNVQISENKGFKSETVVNPNKYFFQN